MCPLGARYKRVSCSSSNGFNALRYSGTENGRKVARGYRDKAIPEAIAPDRSILDGCPDAGRMASDTCDLMPRSEDH